MINAIESVNERQKLSLIPKVKKLVPDLNGKKIAVWGLSFKPKTDDMREAPSITVINELQKLGAVITAFDPVAEQTAKKVVKGVAFSETPLGALENAHALVIATEWDLFRELDKEKMKALMAVPNIIDGRNIYEPEDLKSRGFNYIGVGR